MSSSSKEEPAEQYPHLAVSKKVAEFFSIPEKRLLSSSTIKALVLPRQIAFWICRNIYSMSYPRIGRAFLRDHSTVIQGCKNISARLRKDSEFADLLDSVVRYIDPKHRILEANYQFTLTGDELKTLPKLVDDLLALCNRKEINTVSVHFQLLRGSNREDPYSENQRNYSLRRYQDTCR
jgi:hypothetical protein